MRQITLNMDKRDATLYNYDFIRQGENLATEITINLSEEFRGYRYNLSFQNNSNEPVVTEELTAVNNAIKYKILNSFTKYSGELKIQLNAFNDSGLVAKAYTKLKISESIDGGAIMPEAYVPWYVEAVNAASTATTKAEEAAASAAVAGSVVDTKVAQLNARIDTIITTPASGVTAQEIIDARQGEASLGANLTAIKTNINSLDAYTKRLRAIDQFGIFGASWNKSSNPTLTRTDYNIGAVVNVGVDNEEVDNDFDITQIWGEFKEVTDSYGNVFIRIPKFYIKKTNSANLKTWQVSKTKHKGFYLPWCFWDFTNNKELDYVDVGKYKASLSDDGTKLESKANKYPLINKTIVNFRTYAQANGAGYQQLDIHVMDMLQVLFIIEQATLHSQSKIAGYTAGQYTNTHLALITEVATNRIVVTNAQGALYEVGQAISVGTSQGGNQIFYGRTIEQKQVDTPSAGQTAIIFDGTPVNIAIGNYLYNTGYKNGFSNNIASTVGSINSNSSGKHPFVWHGIESLYGDVWQFVDGININENQVWVCKNANSYASNLFTAPYEQLGYVNSSADGYPKTMGFDANLPFAEFPATVGGSSSTYYSDYYYQNTGQRIACVGGCWYYGSYAGLFYWVLGSASSDSFVSIGGRLLKKPL